MDKLIKIDRNGSKHYETMVTCDRCGGSGIFVTHICNGVGVPARPDAGTCYKCGGEGKYKGVRIERTPEYEAKLTARREARRAKAEAERLAKWEAEKVTKRAEWLERNGFNADGIAWVVLGDTYSAREQIKADGGTYRDVIGWHFAEAVNGYELMQVSVNDIATIQPWGAYDYTVTAVEFEQMRKAEQYKRAGHAPEWVGKVGDKITVQVKHSHTYYTAGFAYRQTQAHHIFKDAEGNIYTWATTSALDIDPNATQMTATIKEHREYKGEKQNAVIRCKFV